MNVTFERELGQIRVSSKGRTIVEYNNYPVNDLCDQLMDWIGIVTEKNAHCFIYQNETRSLFGTFRIEPRSAGWQFTSWNELERAGEMLPLDQWKAILHAEIRPST